MSGVHRGRLAVLLVAVAAAGLTACGDEADDAADTTTTTSTTVAPGEELPEDPPFPKSGAGGSGCEPGPGDLPDGWWYGEIHAPATGDGLGFDLMCFFVGQAAEEAAAEDGTDEPDIEFWIRNEVQTLRDVVVAESAKARCVNEDPEDAAKAVPCDVGEAGGDGGVWLRVQAGEVDRIVEQYTP